jgi:hypothetical protein
MPSPHSNFDEARSALASFQTDLQVVRRNAGNPSYDTLVIRSGNELSKSTITRALNGPKPPSWPVVEKYLQMCGVNETQVGRWQARWASIFNLFHPLLGSVEVPAEHTKRPAGQECDTCGAWVTNPVRHEEWHSRFVPKLTAVPTAHGRDKKATRRRIG